MSRYFVELEKSTVILMTVVLIAACSRGGPAPTSPLHTPSSPLPPPGTAPSSTEAESALPIPPKSAWPGGILLQVTEMDSPRSRLEVTDLEGSDREVLSEVAPALGSAAVSPDQRYVAFFTSGTEADGVLIVWDLLDAETVYEMSVPAEVSHSFRDATSERYLAWSPDGEHLAAVMNRDLHLISIAGQDSKLLVGHREDVYTLAGRVMGAVARPAWSANGASIIYDAFSPPDILTANADEYRDVERVEISTGATRVLLEDAYVVQHTVEPEKGSLVLKNEEGQRFLLALEGLMTRQITSLLEAEDTWLCHPQSGRCAWILSEHQESDLLRIKLDREANVREVSVSELDGVTADCQFQSIVWRPDSDTLVTTVGCDEGVSVWSFPGPEADATRLVTWDTYGSAILLSWLD